MTPQVAAYAGGGSVKTILGGLEQLFSRSQLKNLQKLDPVNQVAVIREAAKNAGALSILKQLPPSQSASMIKGPLSIDELASPARRKFVKQAAALAGRAITPSLPLGGIAQIAKIAAAPEAGIESAITHGVENEIAQGLSPKAFLSELLKRWHTKLAEGSDEAATIGEEFDNHFQMLKKLHTPSIPENRGTHPYNVSDKALKQNAARAMIRNVGLEVPEGIDPRHLMDQASDIHENVTAWPYDVMEGQAKSLARTLPEFSTGKGWSAPGTDFETWTNKHFYTPRKALNQHLTPEDMRSLHDELMPHVYSNPDDIDAGGLGGVDTFHNTMSDAWDLANDFIHGTK